MSEEKCCGTSASIPPEAVHLLCKAIAAGCTADPAKANGVVVQSLTALGPWVTAVIDLIKKGITNLPQILQMLTAAGIVLPSWASLVINILISLLPPTPAPAPTPTPAPTPAPAT
jgi:hypothetical protein